MTTMVKQPSRVPNQNHSRVIGRSRKEFQVAIFGRVQFGKSFAPTGIIDVNKADAEAKAKADAEAKAVTSDIKKELQDNESSDIKSEQVVQ